MEKVWLVYVIFQYDGFDGTEVFGSWDKAASRADSLLAEFLKDGYEYGEYENQGEKFSNKDHTRYHCIRLTKETGEVDLILEEKAVE